MTDIARLALEVDATSVKSAGVELDRMTRSARDTGQVVDRMSREASGGFTTLQKAVAGVATALGAIKVSGLIAEAASLSQRYDQLGIIMHNVGRNAGLTAVEVNKAAQAVQKSGIAMNESRAVIARLITAQIDLSKASQLARTAQDAAVIGQINSSEALERMVHGIVSAEVEILRGIGITVNFENAYKRLAAELGKTTTQLSEHEKMQARVNVVLEEGEKLTGSYEASLANAGKQLGSTERLVQDLKTQLGGLFDSTMLLAVQAYKSSLEDVNGQVDELTSGDIQRWGDETARVIAFLADSVVSLVTVFELAGKGLGSLAAQAAALFRGESHLIGGIQEAFRADVDAGIQRMSVMRDALESQITDRNLRASQSFNWLNEVPDAMEMAGQATEALADSTGKLSDSAKKAASDRARFVDAIKKEVRELGKSRTEILRMEAARQGVSKATEQDIQLLEQEEEIMRQGEKARSEYEKWMRENEALTVSAMTAQEQYNETLANLDDRLAQGGIGIETYRRHVAQAEEALHSVGETGKKVFRDVDQYAIQAARNIQTAFADYLFDPFDKGMKGLLSGFANTVRRMVAELAALRITQSLGIGSLFGLSSGSAMAAGASGGLDAMSMANLGSTFVNAVSSGFGVTGLVGSSIAGLGSVFGSSAASAFGTAMAGDVLGGFAAGGFTPGAMSAANMGAAFSSALGTLGAGAAGVGIGSLLAGNKEVFGLSGTMTSIGGAGIGALLGGPIGALAGGVIGGAVNALFGRGPMKQRDTVLSGVLGDEGFESGSLRTNFRAKGGLFRSNKNDFASIDAVTGEITTDNRKLEEFAASLSQAAREVIGLFNDTTAGVSTSLREIAANLELSTGGLDAFSREIKLVSENGEFLTDAQIADEIAAISDTLSRSLMPELDEFARRGESAFQTVSRLNAEFSVLSDAALILGRSVAESRAMIRAVGMEQRSEFIDAAGGMDALAQKAAFFADNFLDDAQRLQPAIEILDEQMRALGLSSQITKEQFRELVQSYGQLGGINEQLLHSLLNIAPLFVRVKDGLAALNPALDESASAARALAAAEQLIIDKRSALTTAYHREHAELTRIADRFSSLSQSLRNASDQLSLSELSPLTPAQRLDEARSQFERDRDLAFSGDEAAQNRLAESGRAFLQASQLFNASSSEFVADFNLVKSVLDSGVIAAQEQSDIAHRELSYLESSVSNLINIDRNIGSIESLMHELVNATLQGSGNPAISGDMIREFLSTPGRTPQETIQAIIQHGISGGQISDALKVDPSAINQAITQHFAVTDKQIRDYVFAPGRTEQEIYQTALANGISSERLAGAIGVSQGDILEIVKRNGWAAFERGTDYIPRTGFAMLHKGEAVTPATSMDNMAAEIKALKETVAALLRELNQRTGSLIGAVVESGKQNARLIIDSNEDIARTASWRNQTQTMVR